MKPTLVIGIDPGTNTGLAIWSLLERRLTDVSTHDIFDAQDKIALLRDRYDVFLVLEDAHLMKRKPAGNSAARAQGAGSVKRDCTLWRAWAAKRKIPLYRRAPGVGTKSSAGIVKWPAEQFRELTGWQGTTNEHGRDAAMLVYGTTDVHFEIMRHTAKMQVMAKPKYKPKKQPA
jgi:hypothetical protein